MWRRFSVETRLVLFPWFFGFPMWISNSYLCPDIFDSSDANGSLVAVVRIGRRVKFPLWLLELLVTKHIVYITVLSAGTLFLILLALVFTVFTLFALLVQRLARYSEPSEYAQRVLRDLFWSLVHNLRVCLVYIYIYIYVCVCVLCCMVWSLLHKLRACFGTHIYIYIYIYM